jgi:hypothetical protein
MIRHLILCLAILPLTASSAQPGPQATTCAARTPLPGFAGKAIFVMDDTLLFSTPNIELDIDGSPRAYGVRDQGTENICNGLGPLNPPACRGRIQGACYAHCQAAFRSWNGRPQDLGRVMCSIGLGGGHCSVPSVRLQSSPNQDWFVSETSYHPAPPSGIPVSAWIVGQAGQMDSLEVPYFVIPGGFRGMPWDASPGDVGVVVDARGRAVAFVIGDSGGALNEGSARLLAQLRRLAQLPTQSRRNAFGQQVERLSGAVAGDYRVAIFRHSNRRQPGNGGTVLAVTAADLPDFIRRTATERLERLGGPARVLACSR